MGHEFPPYIVYNMDPIIGIQRLFTEGNTMFSVRR